MDHEVIILELDLEKKGEGLIFVSTQKALVFELSKRSCQKGWQIYRGQGYWDAAMPQQWRID